ncbi:MAG: hypothetical protein WCT12_22400 [Verrucomicrobiota bacterium]
MAKLLVSGFSGLIGSEVVDYFWTLETMDLNMFTPPLHSTIFICAGRNFSD